jgi:hypothetical protein
MAHVLVVGIGGFIGSLLRYWLTGLVHRWAQDAFPVGTLLVNVLGCFVFHLRFRNVCPAAGQRAPAGAGQRGRERDCRNCGRREWLDRGEGRRPVRMDHL